VGNVHGSAEEGFSVVCGRMCQKEEGGRAEGAQRHGAAADEVFALVSSFANDNPVRTQAFSEVGTDHDQLDACVDCRPQAVRQARAEDGFLLRFVRYRGRLFLAATRTNGSCLANPLASST
jgi:hypothetical protein